MANQNNKRVAFTQTIDKRSHDRFHDQLKKLEDYASKHGISPPGKGDFLSRILMNPSAMDMEPKEYFN